MAQTPAPPASADAAERGRYAIFEQPDGGLVIPRSAPLCDRCAECGCGEQLEQIRIPGQPQDLPCPSCGTPIEMFRLLPVIVSWARAVQNGKIGMGSMIKAAKGAMKL